MQSKTDSKSRAAVNRGPAFVRKGSFSDGTSATAEADKKNQKNPEPARMKKSGRKRYDEQDRADKEQADAEQNFEEAEGHPENKGCEAERYIQNRQRD